MNDFLVTWERFNAREALAGGTDRHGSEPRAARYVSHEMECWETGDTLTLAIHFPRTTTAASRTARTYCEAFVSGRLKKRKRRGTDTYDVRIEP